MRLVTRRYQVLKVQPGDVLIVDAGRLASMADCATIREHFEKLGIPVSVMGGGVKVVAVSRVDNAEKSPVHVGAQMLAEETLANEGRA